MFSLNQGNSFISNNKENESLCLNQIERENNSLNQENENWIFINGILFYLN